MSCQLCLAAFGNSAADRTGRTEQPRRPDEPIELMFGSADARFRNDSFMPWAAR